MLCDCLLTTDDAPEVETLNEIKWKSENTLTKIVDTKAYFVWQKTMELFVPLTKCWDRLARYLALFAEKELLLTLLLTTMVLQAEKEKAHVRSVQTFFVDVRAR